MDHKKKIKKKKKKSQINTVAILSIVFVLVIWCINLFTLEEDVNRGTYGDMFGAVNALFSGLAFAGIIITLYYQNYQIKLQRRDLKFTKKETAATRKEFELQNKTITTQRFENTFFQMLSLYNNQVDNLVYKTHYSKSMFKGKKSFTGLRNDLKFSIERNFTIANSEKSDPEKQILMDQLRLDDTLSFLDTKFIISNYNTFYNRNKDDLAHYFRNVYHILKLIHNTSDIDKALYVSILRAQLSDNEQAILVYNCLHKNGLEKFKPLAETYSLFQNLDQKTFVNENIIKEFDQKAFS